MIKISNSLKLFLPFLIIFFNLNIYGHATEPVKISAQDIALDLSRAVTLKHSAGDTLQVSTAPSTDGIVQRIEVQAHNNKNPGNWAIFSLANPTSEQLTRFIVAPHYRLVGSGIFRPDLGASRIHSITPSEGFSLDRIENNDSDVFSVTINPGAVITFVAELNAPNLPQLYLWQPDAYKDTLNSYTLYHGIVIGIAGLLAVLLSVLFLTRGTMLFAATAAFSWAVLAYVGIEFHFLTKVFSLAPDREPFWRAASEFAVATTLCLFLFAYLDLKRWHSKLRYGAVLWLLGFIILSIFLSYFPVFTAGLTRAAFGVVVIAGIGVIAYFSYKNYDRAIMLIPAWLLLTAWLVGAYLCVTGRLDNDIVGSALSGGLVVISLLIAFIVIQYAFTTGMFYQGLLDDTERKALAVLAAENAVFDLDVKTNQLTILPDLSPYLGSAAYKLSGDLKNWFNGMHPDDKDQLRAKLDMIIADKKGHIRQTFRLYASDNNYQWFTLLARPVISPNQEIIRCIGILINITDHKKSQEQLLYDSTRDSLTGLPNYQIFIDRLQNLIQLSKTNDNIKPSVFVIDFKNFRKINENYNVTIGDSFLLIIAKRLARLLTPQDTLSRLKADRFAIILNSAKTAEDIANFACIIEKTITNLIIIKHHKIQPSAAIGLVAWTGGHEKAEEILKDADIAVIYAKHHPEQNIVPFRPDFRNLEFSQTDLQNDLNSAIEQEEIVIQYQAIADFIDGKIIGFEASAAWEHKRYGTISPDMLASIIEGNKTSYDLKKYILKKVAADLANLQDDFNNKSFFISINLLNNDMQAEDFIADLKSTLLLHPIRDGRLAIEISEKILMDNPEKTILLIKELKHLGFLTILDDFGQHYSDLSYIINYPFEFIKLARALGSGISFEKKALVKSIINLGHDFGLKIIANGVETQEDAAALQMLHCDYVQSRIIHEPVSFEGVKKLISLEDG